MLSSRVKKILNTKCINVNLLELDDRYNLGKTIDVFCNKMNTIYSFTVTNITLKRGKHWTVDLE
ncbi:hypothetical protein COE07_11055 [Bacillus sp. AFS033286]|nr:hypothetical protein [Bacillus sp. AFS033286]PGX12089.1 hypothetical protein COE07_11055 [Bacillus sp. AFS033286]